jgi:hypothetical protein
MYASALLVLQETPALGQGQALSLTDIWEGGGFMMWPLALCFVIGMLIIVWKFFSLTAKAAANLAVDTRQSQPMVICG